MKQASQKSSAGLAGVVAGESAICTVGVRGKGLNYRGYAIEALAEQSSFEEVAYLLLHGELPNRSELAAFKTRLVDKRTLPPALCAILEQLPAHTHPMDIMRTACSALGCLEPETPDNDALAIAERLLACFPTILLYWYHYQHNNERIGQQSDQDTIAGHFLALLQQGDPDTLARQALDVSLILYAEHEFNASTFAARVCISTGSDFYSPITSAIGTLRGPLHGGANEAAMALIARFANPEQARQDVAQMLQRKEKIMGFGHRVYSEYDPRSLIIQQWSKKLADATGDKTIYPVSEAIEKLLWEEKKLFPNLDFYSASCYHFCAIPVSLYTPIFVMSRVSGWAAHLFEQRANNRLIRPLAEYIGPEERPYCPIEERR